ncbi:hypothetical protein CHARACLAT_002300 [Characodon lateralis]|uniref:Uncharacterized protein n=1 Tax=Characodon lateralis TaxID=208331 RepID=A0ABU7DPQ3_9TELE|nr:hypothetical protein [Characodon lateralis]
MPVSPARPLFCSCLLLLVILPSNVYTSLSMQGRLGLERISSGHWASGAVPPEQVTSPSQNNKETHRI